MILRPPLLTKLLNGSKTQHRILRKPGQWECPMLTGHVYSVKQRVGGSVLARVKITSDRATKLCEITDEDARAEGFTSSKRRRLRDEAINAYETEWQDFDPEHRQDCWVVTFERVPESGRFLPRGPRGVRSWTDYARQGVGDKVDEALLEHDPELARRRAANRGRSVDPLDAGESPELFDLERLTDDARAREEERAELEQAALERMTDGQRLDRARHLAVDRGIPVDHLLSAIRDRIRRMEERVERGRG